MVLEELCLIVECLGFWEACVFFIPTALGQGLFLHVITIVAVFSEKQHDSEIFYVQILYSILYPTYYQSYLPQVSFLNARSSLALRRLAPHLDFTASNTCFCCLRFSMVITSAVAIETNEPEQSNFLASLATLHCSGFSFLNRRISSRSASFRWYFFGGGRRRTGGEEGF